MHIICWTIPLIPALLPLSTNDYGQDDGLNEASHCSLGGNERLKFLWIVTCDTGLAFICFLLMAIWSLEIFRFCQSNQHTEAFDKELSLFQSMRLYPLALFITWVPTFIFEILIFAGILSTFNHTVISPLQVIATQYGTILTIIYFTQSKASRMLWIDLFKKIKTRLLFMNHSGQSEEADNRLLCNIEETDEDILVQRFINNRDSTVSNYANDIKVDGSTGIRMSNISSF